MFLGGLVKKIGGQSGYKKYKNSVNILTGERGAHINPFISLIFGKRVLRQGGVGAGNE